MNITSTIEQASVGITIELSTQEQIIIADLGNALDNNINPDRKECRISTTQAVNIVILLKKLSDNVSSMQEVYDDLFDINTAEQVMEMH